MPSPTPYRRSFSFTDYQAANPSSPEPGNELDAQMNAVKVATNSIISNLGLIQSNSGQLANASVGYQQLQRCVRRGPKSADVVVERERQLFPWRLGFLRSAVLRLHYGERVICERPAGDECRVDAARELVIPPAGLCHGCGSRARRGYVSGSRPGPRAPDFPGDRR